MPEKKVFHCFPIDPQSGVHWCLCVPEDGNEEGFTLSAGENITHVLCAVKKVFETIFGTDIVNAKGSLMIFYHNNNPVTYRSAKIICLSATSTYYMQYIFQFSHELCHFMVPNEVCDSFRWFEESLCQLMPIYVFQKLREQESTTPFWELSNLYATIDDYILKSFHPYTYPETTFTAFFNRVLPEMQSFCYHREYNDAVAAQIKSIFFDNPSLWHIVLNLHLLKDGMPVDDALQTVCHAARIQDETRDRLIACFHEQ